MKLYTYYRSQASFRVRIALNLKGIAREDSFLHLEKGRPIRRCVPSDQSADGGSNPDRRRQQAVPVARNPRLSRGEIPRAAAIAARPIGAWMRGLVLFAPRILFVIVGLSVTPPLPEAQTPLSELV
jgi:hypothetical protein